MSTNARKPYVCMSCESFCDDINNTLLQHNSTYRSFNSYDICLISDQMANRRQTHQYYNNGNGVGSDGSYDLQPQNDQLVEGLRSKVGTLKSLTLDMGEEIKDQNMFIKDMDNTFDSSWGLLSSSVNRVKRLANSGQNRHILYLFLFAFFVFFVIYIIMKFR